MSGREFTDHSPSAVRFECPACGGRERLVWYGDPLGGSRTLDAGLECFHCDAQIAVEVEIKVTHHPRDETDKGGPGGNPPQPETKEPAGGPPEEGRP